jgi:hypothetical protein
MKDYPMLFNDEMVRSILDGRKTQTRRPVKFRPDTLGFDADGFPFQADGYCDCRPTTSDDIRNWINSPFGGPGDRLWVRECWSTVPADIAPPEFTRTAPNGDIILYCSDWKHTTCKPKWRPSIHMPRWASRITLEVLDVRVERVQDITEADACAEGIKPLGEDDDVLENYIAKRTGIVYKPAFTFLWDSIYEDKGLGWDDNPWVWVGTFQRSG